MSDTENVTKTTAPEQVQNEQQTALEQQAPLAKAHDAIEQAAAAVEQAQAQQHEQPAVPPAHEPPVPEQVQQREEQSSEPDLATRVTALERELAEMKRRFNLFASGHF
jgi:hypothetical protein